LGVINRPERDQAIAIERQLWSTGISGRIWSGVHLHRCGPGAIWEQVTGEDVGVRRVGVCADAEILSHQPLILPCHVQTTLAIEDEFRAELVSSGCIWCHWHRIGPATRGNALPIDEHAKRGVLGVRPVRVDDVNDPLRVNHRRGTELDLTAAQRGGRLPGPGGGIKATRKEFACAKNDFAWILRIRCLRLSAEK
jgi:hypothetical protein